ncbi:hypothetical protein HRbin02_01732 [Candidatus Calditenuaceae archaeon HR02]|nr:hypothetical protein HRbin02_01732 [Candidatus Calditenuaceae archaeon HR02]
MRRETQGSRIKAAAALSLLITGLFIGLFVGYLYGRSSAEASKFLYYT